MSDMFIKAARHALMQWAAAIRHEENFALSMRHHAPWTTSSHDMMIEALAQRDRAMRDAMRAFFHELGIEDPTSADAVPILLELSIHLRKWVAALKQQPHHDQDGAA